MRWEKINIIMILTKHLISLAQLDSFPSRGSLKAAAFIAIAEKKPSLCKGRRHAHRGVKVFIYF